MIASPSGRPEAARARWAHAASRRGRNAGTRRWQLQHFREDVVGKRAAEIGQDRGGRAMGAADRIGREPDVGMVGVQPRRHEHVVARRADLDAGEAMPVEEAPHHAQHVVGRDVHREAQLHPRPGPRRNGVDRRLRVARLEGQHLQVAPAEHLPAPVSPGSPTTAPGRGPPSSDVTSMSASARRTLSGMARGVNSGTRIWPVGPTKAGDGVGQFDRGIGDEPAPVAGVVPALARVDPQVRS